MANSLIDFGVIQPEIALQPFERARQQARQEQANQLAALQLRAAQRGEEEALTSREAFKTADPVKALFAAGLGPQAIQTAKTLQDQKAAQLKQVEEDLKIGRGIAERAFSAGRAASMSAPGTEKAAILSVLNQYQGKGIDLSQDIDEVSKMSSNQALEHAFNRSQELKNLAEMITSDTGAAIIRTPRFQQPGVVAQQPIGAFQGEPQQVMNQLATIPDPAERAAATAAYQRQLTAQAPTAGTRIPKALSPAQEMQEAREQTRIGLEQRRVELAEKEAARKAEGAAEPLSKKEVQAREAKYPQATKAVQTFDATTNDLISDLQKLKDHPGLNGITGLIYGRTPGVTGKAREAEAIYDRIMARGGFSELQEMRNASPTGGALGNVSNAEGQQLRAAFAAIDRRQDPESVRRAIDDAIVRLQGSKQRVRDAYNMTYEYKGIEPAISAQPVKPAAQVTGGPLTPAEQAELEQLRARFGKR